MKEALGVIEVLGLTAALRATDTALKTADVTFESHEKIIGVGKSISLTLCFRGEVAALWAALEAAQDAASKVGVVIASRIIANPHREVTKITSSFNLA